MEAVNCPKCGKLFTRIMNPLCPSCDKEEEQAFQTLRNYIEENENCTIGELSKETGVSQKRILRLIREGRLEISKGMRGEVRCMTCGGPIAKGQYCDACIIKINQNINDMFSNAVDKQRQGAIMHISERSKK